MEEWCQPRCFTISVGSQRLSQNCDEQCYSLWDNASEGRDVDIVRKGDTNIGGAPNVDTSLLKGKTVEKTIGDRVVHILDRCLSVKRGGHDDYN